MFKSRNWSGYMIELNSLVFSPLLSMTAFVKISMLQNKRVKMLFFDTNIIV